ncbi:LOW QUALITY PROTEIN: vacuolar protein sorting-associated protein 13A [Scyliorhinus canicula]|uniref:LOW QUALITY PROTEIN: vacuolar protein sorting-associated protein 13A n=1 Tax=Scyliorhinus canicula TaxID=7830 RepID=UPI0018F69F05|nr:LOW QUALITY PROTEIN: vacuolar protein sorting-associated protein 13A [Scyliorhinus canicula]
MVFESLVVDVLNRFLGDYVVNVDSSQLQLGIWGGNVVLNNLEVKENALCELNVPFKVKAGHIAKLELKIPWNNLYGQAVEATVDGIYLLIVPCASIEYDAEKEELQLQEIKQRELQRIEEAKQKVADKDIPKQQQQDSFIEKLITQVIKNLQVKITNIHIRYEDNITNQDSPLSFGISLQNLSLETTDERWNPCLHDQCEHVFNKLVRLDYLCAYWNVNTKMYSKSSQVESLKDLKIGVSTSNFIPETYQFVFQPLSAKAKLEMNPRAGVDFASPKMNLEVNLQDIAIELKRPQFLSIMELLGSIDMMSRNLPYRKYKPNVPCHNNAKKWWEYAINGILEENIQPALNSWSGTHSKHRQKVKNYRKLYKSRIKTKSPDEEVISALKELEKELDVFNITLARQQAEVEVMKAGYKIYRPGAKVEEDNSGGWFDWVWSWTGAKEDKSRDSKSGIDLLMTPEEKVKLYTAIGYSEAAGDPTMPKRYEAVKISVKLVSMSISVREEHNEPEIMKFAVIDVNTTLIQRPGAQAIKFEAMISTLEVTGLPQKMHKPLLLSSRGAMTGDKDILLSIMFETNPLDERADQRLKVESHPLEIVYDARTVNRLIDFFRPPTDVQLEELTSATLMKLEEFRDKTSTGLMYIIETQKVLDVKVNLMASYIIIPENGFYDKSASLLVLDLGNLKMSSKSRARLPQITAGESTLEDIMDRAYDCFDIQLSSVQLLYAKPHDDWKTARKTKVSSQHILQPVDLKLDLSRAMVVSDPRMPKFKVYGGLALLSICISDQKLTRVLELIDSIPKPKSNSSSPSVKSLQPQILSPNMTPRSVQKRAVHKDIYSSVLSMADSDDEFYDARSSPVDEPAYLLAKDNSPQITESFRQKQLRKQETLKNMTDFQMQFEITKMSLGICRHVGDTEHPVLQLVILGLGTELKIRTYDMTSHTFLKEVSLKCPEQTDVDKKPVYIITTLDNYEDDLLTIEYIKANRDGPDFKTSHNNTEQIIKVNFSSLDLYLHAEALMSSILFLKSLIPSSNTKVTSDEQLPVVEEKKEEMITKKKTAYKKSKFEDVIKLHAVADLALLRVFICDQTKKIAEVSIEGLDVEVVLRKTLSEVTTKLKNIVVMDSNEDALFKKAVSIHGKEVFSFKMISHVDATGGAAYTNMDVVDSYIKLTVGCIQVIFVKKFVSSLLAFLNVFQAASEAVTEATVQAASGVKDLSERSTRMALDIHIKAPVVVVPQSPVSKNVIVADFGFIIIRNSFSIIKQKDYKNVPPIIDSMKVSLRELKLYRTIFEDGAFWSEISLLQPVNLEVVVERNLAAAWYHEVPDVKIIATLKPLHVVLSQDDLVIILKTLNENLGDNSIEAAPVQADDDGNRSGPSQISAGRTVVTAAVVETQKPLRIKTTLKLGFRLDELSLILYSHSLDPVNMVKELRSEKDELAEFKLHTFSSSIKMLSDGSMNANVKLLNCMLDDKRKAMEKATSRMVEMKLGVEKNEMIDFSYRQGREGMILDATVRDIYVCASMEFLLTVADFFVKANNQVSVVPMNKPTVTTSKEKVSSQASSKMELHVHVQNPEIVFVADLTRADAPSLVVTAQCEADITNDSEGQQMTATVKDLKVTVCPFLTEKQKSQVTTVLQPCSLVFRSVQAPSGPSCMELAINSLILKVSPVIINTVITITSALTPAVDNPREKDSEIPPDLWNKKNVKDLKLWILENPENSQRKLEPTTQLGSTGQNLKMTLEFICLTLEAGVGHRTVPMLLAKSAFKGDVKNWSTLINLQCHLNLEIHYYNEVLAVWEPLLEPLEIENTDDFRPWELGIKMKKKVIKTMTKEGEEENINSTEFKTVIQISSKDQLNITMSKCGLTMLNNLATAFAEAAGQTSDVFQKDQAPFTVKNCLGLVATIYPSDSFIVIGANEQNTLYELKDGDLLNMDYQRTKNEKDQLSNLTNASSKSFYISLKTGTIGAHDREQDSMPGKCLLAGLYDSPIKNHFSVPFNVFEDVESDLKSLGTIQPNEEFSVPLLSYRSDLRLQLMMNDKKLDLCEAITFGHLNTSTEIVFHRKCQFSGGDELDSVTINIVAMLDTLASDNPDENNNAYVLHLWPSAILQNLLPYTLSVSLMEESMKQRLTLDEGHSAQLHDAVLDKSKLALTIIDYLEHNWAGEYEIKSSQTDIELIKFNSYFDGEESEMDIAIHTTYNVGHVMLELYSPYWMMNKTGRMLQYKADDVHRKHPLDYKKPLLFSFGSKCYFEKNKVQLRITDSQLSDSFSLDTVGSYGSVKCKGPKKEYQVGVRIDNSSFNLTRIVTFTPFYMLINRTKHRLEIAEECESKWLGIDSDQCNPFWPAKNSERIVVRIVGCGAAPQKVYFKKQENCLLLHLDNKFGGIIVEVHVAEHSTLMTFKDYHEGAAPFFIINHTKASPIEYHQSSSPGKGHKLEPGKATYYTWEDPTGSRVLSWNCSCEDVARELSTVEDTFLEFSQESGKIYLASLFEGLQRIVLFTDDTRTYKLAQECDKAELAEQEIILSLQNLGISLINNSTKQEVVFIGITSSDIVWESKPKIKSRWKPMSRKQTAQLEEVYKEYIETSPQENRIVELPCDFQALLTPNGVDMKILLPSEVPIRRNYLPAIKVEYIISTHQRSLRVQIYKIQIQNQLSGAIFPFPFYPIIPPKSITMESAPKPFADVSIITRLAGQSAISRFRYFKVLIQEMDLKLDFGFLYAVMDLFAQSTDDVLAEQKLELFKKDIEYIQAELLTESAIDNSSVSLYEYFHISPIKLHLSFSMSSGGEESNKQQETEVIPLQSLNFLLKSIGATLTDVQDVVFKLAFFEINYQFYTTQQLQWEVIRHYSKQAIKQLYVLVLGLDVLGNPFGLIRDLSEGVEAFFYEPYQGAIQGPEEFMEGMALGVKALVGGAVGGIAGAASRITGAMAKGVAAITMDEEYQQRRREAMNRQPSGIKEGIARGGKGLVSGFVSGITGIVTKPIKGAQKEGTAGFFKGIGKGLVGAVARPTGGIIDLASSTFQGIKRATETSEDVVSLRPPRFIHEDGVIRPYRLREGIGMQMLQKIENGRYAKYKYFGHKMINNSDLFLITKSGILFVTQGAFGQLNCEWQYSFEEFTKEPFIVDGRRLRIEAKERVKSVFHAKEYGKIVNFKTADDAKWILAKLQEVWERGGHDHHPKI